MTTSIEWTDDSWNPIRAINRTTGEVGWFCEHMSHGCDHCYAEKMNVNTYFGNGLPYKASSLPQLELFLDEKMLAKPLSWRKPRKVFVCSMTDLFGRFVPDEWIDRIFAAMALAKQHTFQVLTKRPERMVGWVTMQGKGQTGNSWSAMWPPPNIWLGVSAEDQKTADERIPLLMKTPAAVRWISAEPLLGLIDLEAVPTLEGSIDWVVVGGESGHGARPMHPDWARSLRDQCNAASVPFFFKQWGNWAALHEREDLGPHDSKTVSRVTTNGKRGNKVSLSWEEYEAACLMGDVGKKKAGRILDGRTWDEYPQ